MQVGRLRECTSGKGKPKETMLLLVSVQSMIWQPEPVARICLKQELSICDHIWVDLPCIDFYEMLAAYLISSTLELTLRPIELSALELERSVIAQ